MATPRKENADNCSRLNIRTGQTRPTNSAVDKKTSISNILRVSSVPEWPPCLPDGESAPDNFVEKCLTVSRDQSSIGIGAKLLSRFPPQWGNMELGGVARVKVRSGVLAEFAPPLSKPVTHPGPALAFLPRLPELLAGGASTLRSGCTAGVWVNDRSCF